MVWPSRHPGLPPNWPSKKREATPWALGSTVVAKAPELLAIAPPVLVHLYIEFDMDLFGEEFFQYPSGFHPYPFKGRALMADDDPLLGVPLHHDDRADPDDVLILQEFLGLHLHGIGDFLFVVYQDLFPDGLVHKEPFRFVRQLVLGI